MIDRDEYRALTTDAAVWIADGFGQFEVTGPDAHAFVNRVTTADLSVLPPGRFAHALLLHDDASILGRVTIYRFPDRTMLLVDRAARTAAWNDIVARKRGNLRLRDISEDIGLAAVRGPRAVERLEAVLAPLPAQPGDVTNSRCGGVDVFAARASSDGADGVELYCRRRDLPAVRATLEQQGIPVVSDAVWALHRLEWGSPTIGVEIDPDDTPVEAGLEALVVQGKGAPYPGEVAYAERRRTGAIRRLVGFTAAGDLPPPEGADVLVNDRVVDRVRSVGVSPRAGIIGMTAVPVGGDLAGTPLVIRQGATEWAAVVVARPFVTRELR
jgi:glycine cleavage system aminomethyltransferase T